MASKHGNILSKMLPGYGNRKPQNSMGVQVSEKYDRGVTYRLQMGQNEATPVTPSAFKGKTVKDYGKK